MTCGIYVLYYETDDFQYYIGKSTNIEGRYKEHCRKLKNKEHKNIGLTKGFEKYGSPTIDVLEVVDCIDTLLFTKEVLWIKEFNSYINGMNETPGGEGTGSGENHPQTLYTNNEYINLVKYIVYNKDKSLVQVSKDLNMDINVIRGIACGAHHNWLEKELPNEYAELLSLSGTRNNIATGELSHNSIYSNKTIVEVLFLLLENYTAKEVSIQLNINVQTVYGIFNGSDHLWLKEEYPNEYSLMRELHSLSKVTYPLIKSPEGIVYKVVNQTVFAKEHGLEQANLSSVLLGKRKIHKNWVLLSKKEEIEYNNGNYTPQRTPVKPAFKPIKSPEGTIFYITNQTTFAKEHGLHPSKVSAVLLGTRKSHKGWRLADASDIAHQDN